MAFRGHNRARIQTEWFILVFLATLTAMPVATLTASLLRSSLLDWVVERPLDTVHRLPEFPGFSSPRRSWCGHRLVPKRQ